MRRPRSGSCRSGCAARRSGSPGAAAIAAATGAHGEGGSKMRGAAMAAALAASDAELFGSPAGMTEAPAAFRAMFAQGLEGYADDRLADGAGWITFDVASTRCPATVLHSRSDQMADVIHARHTAELIPGANLVIFDFLGHFQHYDQGRARDPRPPAAPATQRGTRTVPGHAQPRHTLTGAPLRRRTASHSQAISGRTGHRPVLPATLAAYTDHPFRAQHGRPRWLSDCRPYRRISRNGHRQAAVAERDRNASSPSSLSPTMRS